jgi:hypothetical protein
MLTIVLLVIGVALVGLLVAAAMQPSSFRVARSIRIAAPAGVVFPQINDLRKAHVWSPWVKLDPSANYTFDGPPAGVGASSSWSGSGKVGEGRQTIVESRTNELVRLKLEFIKPFESTCTAEFILQPEGDATHVTWALSGQNNFASKVFCLLMNQDKMIGGPFEEGLANLKALTESSSTR